jgi:hypothetical protein
MTWSPKPIYTRTLYEGVIIPKLTYGSALWGHAAQKATIRKKLRSLQRLSLTAITFVRVELLRELAGRHTVTLQWVKAQVGIPGNEMADKAAKAGSKYNRFRQMEISNSRTELKTFIRDARNLEWARLWADREGKDYRQTRLFFPTVNPKVWKDILKHIPTLRQHAWQE